ncbi:14487_t:CDS:2 [Entrophospora sp. SA101]|nr:14487_t:CDS:2 [Entrophospora sp. SA101]
MVQQPDGNTNMFTDFRSSMLAMYNFLTAFLAQKAKIISDIELFYLLPNQRHWKEWFPDVLKIVDIPKLDKKNKMYHKNLKNDIKEIENNIENKLEQSKADCENLKNDIKEIENNMREIEKNLENKLNHNNEQMLIQMQNLLNEIKSLKK